MGESMKSRIAAIPIGTRTWGLYNHRCAKGRNACDEVDMSMPLSPFRAISQVLGQPLQAGDGGPFQARQIFEQAEAQFETDVPALAALSYHIEMEALRRHVEGGRIFVGFQ